MNVEFTPEALDDVELLLERNPRLLRRLLRLIEDMRRDPFDGLGKPEALRGDLSGWWSRRIDSEHRVVYRVVGSGGEARLQIVQCARHY